MSRPFESSTEWSTEWLKQTKEQEAIEAYVQELRASADIVIN